MHPKPALFALFFASCLTVHAEIATKQVATGFERPIWAGVPKGIDGKLWVMEQAGTVWIVDQATGEREKEPFLEIKSEVSREGNEEGLLGLAFAADFATTGRYYVNLTDKDQHTRIVRFISKDQKTTDPKSAEVLLKYQQDFRNHNGGWIAFGPDGYLYIANGDGGSANDPKQRAQDLDSLLGKILRIDVSPETGYKVPADNPFVGNKAGKPEIWAYGVRNPWRNSFDRETGDFWMADVGQGLWEEINFMPKDKGNGANYGWRLREGHIATPAKDVGGDAPKDAIEPIYVYPHGGGKNEGISVTGGYVYRGEKIKELKGRYIFADYQNPRIWSIKQDAGEADGFIDHTDALQPEGGRINLISSFAEDNDGELYIIDHTGPIYQIIEK
jgi:glucose/arabinose dehydrogenase